MPSTTPPQTVLTARFADAVAYASAVHANQSRKGQSRGESAIPYVAHLLGVASLVLEAGGDEDMAIAGLLHDAAEDQGGEARLLEIDERFGARVAGIVRTCSDSLAADPTMKEAYASRKARYLAALENAPVDDVTVSMADKLHNARAILTDLSNGVDIFAEFHGSTEQVLAYYDACVRIGRAAGVSATLMTPLADTVRAIAAQVDTLQHD